jgi:aspartyl-tRNA(Asn)/glutamyl-tRNA(Gln) amidotransferase subunit C
MKLSHAEILHIAALAKIGVTEEDIGCFQEQLSSILNGFEILKQADTENVPPTTQTNVLANVMQDDCAHPSLPTDAVLVNAPRHVGDFFRIRAVMEED